MRRWLRFPDRFEEDDARRWIIRQGHEREEGRSVELAIEDAHNGAVLGGTSLLEVDAVVGCAQVGYWVRPEARGRGVAVAAVGLLTEWAFAELGLVSLRVEANVDNEASHRVAQRCGFGPWAATEPAEGRTVTFVRAAEPARPRTLLVRHGETAYTAIARHERAYDGSRRDLAPLTPRGVAQIVAVASRLRFAPPQLIVTSPYARALHSAAILSRALDVELAVDIDLHDWLPAPGRMSGLDQSAVDRAVEEFAGRARGDHRGPVTAETAEEVRSRVSAVLARHSRPGTLLVMTHDTLIREATGAPSAPVASIHLAG